MNYHSHKNRDEVWTVIKGSGCTYIDGVENKISVGDVVRLPANKKHKITAITELKLIEIQIGYDIHVEDKEKY